MQQEATAQQLYPVYKPDPVKKESIEQKRLNTAAWKDTPEAQAFAKFVGKETYDKFVANRLLEDSTSGMEIGQ